MTRDDFNPKKPYSRCRYCVLRDVEDMSQPAVAGIRANANELRTQHVHAVLKPVGQRTTQVNITIAKTPQIGGLAKPKANPVLANLRYMRARVVAQYRDSIHRRAHHRWPGYRLEDELTQLFGHQTDLVSKAGLHRRIKEQVTREAQALYAA